MANANMTKEKLLAELAEREERLQESEERWREFVDRTDDLVTQVDSEGRFLYVNGAARKVFGLEPEGCVGQLAFDFIHPDDQERTMTSFAGWVGEKVRSASFENRQVSRSGEVHHMLWTINPRYDGEGNVKELWSIARVITERKQAEEELRQYKHIVSSSSDMIALLDERFIYLSANAAYVETFGMTPDEILGNTVSEVFGEEFFEKVIKPHAQRCLSGETVSYQEWFDFPAHGPRYMEINYYPYIDADNQIKGFVVNARNATERKQAEEALRISLALQRVRNEILQMEEQEDWEKVVLCLREEMAEKVRFDACGVNLVDLRTKEWTYYAVDAKGELTQSSFAEIHPAIVQAMESGASVYRPDPSAPFYGDMPPEIQSIIDIPFSGGTLAVNSSLTNAFSPRDIETMEQFAGVMSEGHRRLEDLTALYRQEWELRKHRDHLEEMVQERTDELKRTNAQIQEEIEEGKRREEVIRRQSEEILEMSTPVMQMWEGVVVAPLIGSLDSHRAQRFMEMLLQRIVETNSPVALVDITGVPMIDTQTAQNLIEAVGAVRLLGAKVILTGVRPAIAQTLVHLGIDLSDVETRSSLAAGLRLALGRNGLPCETHERRL